MKKLFKILSEIAIAIVCSFITIKVFADNKVEIKEYIQSNSYSAVLYSNNKLYIWGGNYYEHTANRIIENVKDIVETTNYTNQLMIIDTNDNLKMVYFSSRTNEETNIFETKVKESNVLKTNIKTIIICFSFTNIIVSK